MDCPECQSTILTEQYDGIEICRCSKCRGIWLAGSKLLELAETIKSHNKFPVDLKNPLRQIDTRSRSCPRCLTQVMRTYKYGDTDLDTCMICKGIWFDSGELEAVVNRCNSAKLDSVDSENSIFQESSVNDWFGAVSTVADIASLFDPF